MVWFLAACSCAWAQGPPHGAPASPPSLITPFARGEVLNYSVNWPSGLSLGDAQFKAGGGEPGWQFEFTLDAGIPALQIRDRFHALADAQFCSERLEKDSARGPRKSRETVKYDAQKAVAIRHTRDGGTSEVAVPDCVKDGLTFLYFVRRELAGGRLPPPQTINFGAAYQITARYSDSPQIESGGVRQPTDRIAFSLRGPASQHSFEIFFARDPARTPLLVRVPFALGTFALELAR